MKKNEKAVLSMKKTLLSGMLFNESAYSCTVWKYHPASECIYLVLEDAQLTEVSLDAIYDVCVEADGVEERCEGRIKERYRAEAGNMLKFQVENGFYKNTIKLVDKQ